MAVLKPTEQQTVKTEQHEIVIEPADPEVIYVPTYDTSEVYGDWPYYDYPPYYFYDTGYVTGSNLLSFGLGMVSVPPGDMHGAIATGIMMISISMSIVI